MAAERGGIQDYDEYQQTHEYVHVGGVVQLPVASRTSAHRLIRLHGGYGKRIVKWTASRHGRPPQIPLPSARGDTLLNTTIAPILPRPNDQAAGYDWRVSGVYEFAQDTVRVPGTDAFPVGSYPWTGTVQGQAAAILATETTESPSPSNFNAYYSDLGVQIYDPVTGAYIWPFLALPPAFSGALL